MPTGMITATRTGHSGDPDTAGWGRMWISSADSVSYLSLWLALLFGLSANQVLGPMGAVGTPAIVVALGATMLWLAGHLVPGQGMPQGIQPMRVAILLYSWYVLSTMALAFTRPLTDLEQTGTIREAIWLVSLVGVSLLVMDGVKTLDRLRTLMWRITVGAGFMAGTGILESLTGSRFLIRLPGLTFNQAASQISTRSNFNRPYATALHPIELGVVLGALFPLALHFALTSEGRRRRVAITFSGLIGLGIPLAISRSGIVAFTAAIVVMALGWSWRRRLEALVVGCAVLPALWLGIPGLVGTFRNLFTSFDTDSSVQQRIERVPKILDVIRDHPLFGLGAGTYSVDDYFLVDNEFWVTTMEIGIIGICLTFAVVSLAALMAATSRHHPAATDESLSLGYAIAAGIIGLTVSMFTFDAFFYHILRGLLFILFGASAALWRLTRSSPTHLGRAPSSELGAAGESRPVGARAPGRNQG